MYTCCCHKEAHRDVVVGHVAHTWDCVHRNYYRLSAEFVTACIQKYGLDPKLPLGFSQAIEDAAVPQPIRDIEVTMVVADDGEDAASALLAAYAIVLVLPFLR